MFCTFFVAATTMKKFFILLLVVALASSCGVSRRVSRGSNISWVGHPTLEILQAMGNPDRIDNDGKDGSILRYEAKPNYEDPSYDILDPNAKPGMGGYAYFYVDREGECYWVDATRKLPNPNNRPVLDDNDEGLGIWVDILIYLPLFLIGILL